MCECTAMVEHSGLSVQAPHQLFSARYNGWRSMLLLPLCRRQSTLKICAEQGGRSQICRLGSGSAGSEYGPSRTLTNGFYPGTRRLPD